ncbi:Imm49 family immunity protein [Streptomyces drozdowiczii]|uniref:Imm49 family immunity protein n=1 Tax=Streptomyces drozdowiczii TaxID=202862 RepID=UPI002248501F|nr:Imm49 family immunity protein [Streptomyces drozdowiczii]MCX0243947.1 immunity 49 family protein [Streptomyces drozdowiczii]
MHIERHVIDEARVSAARDGFEGRIGGLVRSLSSERMTANDWSLLAGEFLDHLGALSVSHPALDTPQAEFVLRAAEQAASGAVAFAAYFPGHPFTVFLDYVNFGVSYDAGADGSPVSLGMSDWLDAFCLAVLTGTVEGHREAFYHARNPQEEARFPVDALADGLMAYVLGDLGDDDADYPPTEAQVLGAIDGGLARIRAFGAELGRDVGGRPDYLALLALRALAAGDREAFDAALSQLLLTYRSFGEVSTHPSSLLPLPPLALAALAYRRRGWTPAEESDYLPRAVVTGRKTSDPASRADMVAALRSGAELFERPGE